MGTVKTQRDGKTGRTGIRVNLQFEKFEIIEILKKDEHAAVYLANHIFLNKKVILKTLSNNDNSEKSSIERFKREAKILANLDSPHIIKILDFGTFGEYFYISFEYFESNNLRQFLKTNNLNSQQKKEVFIQILKGIRVAHNNKIIHRDLKPENILINKNNIVKIADFGLALSENEAMVTSKNSIVGTPSYMSPEQVLGDKLTYQSDIFSIGIIAYEIYTGNNPFLKGDINSTINQLISFDENTFKDFILIPEDIRETIKSMLQKDARKRPGSVSEILDNLNIKDEIPQTSNTKSKINNKNLFLFGIPLIAFVTVLFYFLFLNKTLPVIQSNSQEYHKDTTTELSSILDKKIPETKTVDPQTSTLKQNESIIPANNEVSISSVPEKVRATTESAEISVECSPWAIVYFDSVRIDVTPMKGSIKTQSGLHELKLINPDYPPFITKINLKSNESLKFRINLDTLVGFLNCQILPWGELFINGKSFGQSPFKKKIALTRGKYLIKVKNPSYGEFEEYIEISSKDVFNYNFNFDNYFKKPN